MTSNMDQIACKHCGGPISLNDVWDRTPDGFRPSDWKTHHCNMCGGVMTFYGRWIDPPKAHRQCLDGRWHEEPCSMCFGPMAIPPGIEPAPKFHSRCVPENWYERTCEACDQPLKIHVDWDEVPTVHRRCETQDWYEKQCKYCNATLKVHIDWETAPDAHDECKPATPADVPVSAPPATVPDATPQIVLAPVSGVDGGTEVVDPVVTNGNCSKAFVFYAEPETEPEPAIDTNFEPGVEAEASPVNAPEIATETGADILIERNGSVERDVEIADTAWERFNAEMTELTQPIEQPVEQPLDNENRHEYTCAECGEHVVRLEGTLTEACRLCQNANTTRSLSAGRSVR